jgi:hypothetical protein
MRSPPSRSQRRRSENFSTPSLPCRRLADRPLDHQLQPRISAVMPTSPEPRWRACRLERRFWTPTRRNSRLRRKKRSSKILKGHRRMAQRRMRPTQLRRPLEEGQWRQRQRQRRQRWRRQQRPRRKRRRRGRRTHASRNWGRYGSPSPPAARSALRRALTSTRGRRAAARAPLTACGFLAARRRRHSRSRAIASALTSGKAGSEVRGGRVPRKGAAGAGGGGVGHTPEYSLAPSYLAPTRPSFYSPATPATV